MRFMGPSEGGPSPAITGLPRGIALEGMAVGLGSHLGSFFSTDPGRLRLGLPFLRDGIRSAQPCVLFALPDTREQYLRSLERESVDVKAAQRNGLLTLLAIGSVSPEEFIARLESVFIDVMRQRPGPFRFLGEPVAGLASVKSIKGFLTLEHQCGALAKRFPVVMLCAYDVRAFDGPTVLECLKLHHDTFAHELGYFLS
jgi:hypothetical protein